MRQASATAVLVQVLDSRELDGGANERLALQRTPATAPAAIVLFVVLFGSRRKRKEGITSGRQPVLVTFLFSVVANYVDVIHRERCEHFGST